MKTAILNECFLSDSHIEYLKSLGDVEIYSDTTDEEKAIRRIKDKDIVLTDMYECPLNKNLFAVALNLKFMCINSTGYDLVDLAAATKHHVKVANIPGFSTEAVAEHTFALLLALNRHIPECDRFVRQHPFEINPSNRDHDRYLGFTLAGKTLGIIGMGAIGSHVAKIACGFGMEVIGYNRHQKTLPGIKQVDLTELLSRSDIVTLHVPLNEQSKGMINKNSIAKMKDGAILINTARGGCVVAQDLAEALRSGKLVGAGLDTLDEWSAHNPLLSEEKTIITPHSAWFTQDALNNIGDRMIDNVKAFMAGYDLNIVNL